MVLNQNLEIMNKYLNFVEIKDTGKTKVFLVTNTWGYHLGLVKWHGAWRKYVFETSEAIYDVGCLNEIVSFINKLMEERKNGSTKRK